MITGFAGIRGLDGSRSNRGWDTLTSASLSDAAARTSSREAGRGGVREGGGGNQRRGGG
jgi:hypothetical protein